ncbi:hypothetical protein SAMN04488523_105318 [Sulfitobacter brevis]|uniref:Uncharacterized protein n=1 Tax=Sulfitobacter brevis TaxID=74348 RepID=A0A1I1YNG7_9RHOB|nr:hypothetical protein SAMN04488523_105318 [Sulfitobacter brevis]
MPKVESGPRKLSSRQRRSFGLKLFVAVVTVLWFVALYMVVVRFFS